MHPTSFSRFALRAQRTAPRAPREYGPPRRGLPVQRTVHRSVHPPCIGEFRGVHEAAHHMRCAGAKRARSLPTFIPERMQWSLSETIMPMTDRGRRLMHDAIGEVIEELMICLPALTSASSSALRHPPLLPRDTQAHRAVPPRHRLCSPGQRVRTPPTARPLSNPAAGTASEAGGPAAATRPGAVLLRNSYRALSQTMLPLTAGRHSTLHTSCLDHRPPTDVSLLRRRTSRPRFIDGLICSSIM